MMSSRTKQGTPHGSLARGYMMSDAYLPTVKQPSKSKRATNAVTMTAATTGVATQEITVVVVMMNDDDGWR